MDMNPDRAQVQVLLAAWREQGTDRLDPVRFWAIEALARRVQAYEGEVRRVLDARLSDWIDAYAADVQAAAGAPSNGEEWPVMPAREGLRALCAGIAQRHGADDHGATAAGARSRHDAFPQLAALDEFRQRWMHIRSESQLRQSLAQRPPENAGPLNSSALVHRAIALMREASPGYLRQFLGYVDALSGIEQLSGGGPVASTNSGQAGRGKRAPRSRPGKRRR